MNNRNKPQEQDPGDVLAQLADRTKTRIMRG